MQQLQIRLASETERPSESQNYMTDTDIITFSPTIDNTGPAAQSLCLFLWFIL